MYCQPENSCLPTLRSESSWLSLYKRFSGCKDNLIFKISWIRNKNANTFNVLIPNLFRRITVAEEYLAQWGQQKYPLFHRRHIQTHFLEWKALQLDFDWHSTDLFPKFQLTISRCWFRLGLGAEQATSHYLNQRRFSLLTQICVARLRRVKSFCCVCVPINLFVNKSWWYHGHTCTTASWQH